MPHRKRCQKVPSFYANRRNTWQRDLIRHPTGTWYYWISLSCISSANVKKKWLFEICSCAAILHLPYIVIYPCITAKVQMLLASTVKALTCCYSYLPLHHCQSANVTSKHCQSFNMLFQVIHKWYETHCSKLTSRLEKLLLS